MTVCTTQMAKMITEVRFRVTTCLYRSPNDKARSRSTLIPVSVERDTPQKMGSAIKPVNDEYRQISQLSFIAASKKIIKRGCEMRPTQRSVVARLLSKSLEGGWSKDTLRRATSISVLPRTAVTVKKLFRTVINFSWPCVPAVKLVQQKVCSSPPCCPSLEGFAAAITNPWIRFFQKFCLNKHTCS